MRVARLPIFRPGAPTYFIRVRSLGYRRLARRLRESCLRPDSDRTETEYHGACEEHEHAKCPKGRLVGMQPLKSQAHQVRSEGRANDEAGEQVAVQLTETLHLLIGV